MEASNITQNKHCGAKSNTPIKHDILMPRRVGLTEVDSKLTKLWSGTGIKKLIKIINNQIQFPCFWNSVKCLTMCREEPDMSFDFVTDSPGQKSPRTVHEGPEGNSSYSSTLSLTSALDGGGWLTSRAAHFTPRKGNRYPFYRRLCRSQGRSGRVRKISPPPGFDLRTVQPVACRYTDYAIPTHKKRL